MNIIKFCTCLQFKTKYDFLEFYSCLVVPFFSSVMVDSEELDGRTVTVEEEQNAIISFATLANPSDMYVLSGQQSDRITLSGNMVMLGGVLRNDAGLLVVNATNDLGTTLLELTLVVQCKCIITVPTGPGIGIV